MRRLIHKVSLVLLVAFLRVSAQEDVAKGVTGLLNHSVQLSNYLTWTVPMEEIVWTFTSERKTVKVAAVKNGRLDKYADQFTDRIKTLNNGATLVIEQLTLRDSGIYMADITLITKESHERSFLLSVFEPVLTPSIGAELEERTTDWCNMTVHCSVPKNPSAVSYIWKYRRRDSDYQLYDNTEATVQLPLQPQSWDIELLCTVHNPADWKNVTLHVQPICALDREGCAIYWRLALTATFMVLSICCICLSYRYK